METLKIGIPKPKGGSHMISEFANRENSVMTQLEACFLTQEVCTCKSGHNL